MTATLPEEIVAALRELTESCDRLARTFKAHETEWLLAWKSCGKQKMKKALGDNDYIQLLQAVGTLTKMGITQIALENLRKEIEKDIGKKCKRPQQKNSNSPTATSK